MREEPLHIEIEQNQTGFEKFMASGWSGTRHRGGGCGAGRHQPLV